MKSAEFDYRLRKQNALKTLKAITKKVESYDTKNENINWGHAGSMAHVDDELKDVLIFLSE